MGRQYYEENKERLQKMALSKKKKVLYKEIGIGRCIKKKKEM